MNQEVDPEGEERRGGAGELGKLLLSAGDKQLAILCHVPKALQVRGRRGCGGGALLLLCCCASHLCAFLPAYATPPQEWYTSMPSSAASGMPH